MRQQKSGAGGSLTISLRPDACRSAAAERTCIVHELAENRRDRRLRGARARRGFAHA